jgi:hypothetical protein
MVGAWPDHELGWRTIQVQVRDSTMAERHASPVARRGSTPDLLTQIERGAHDSNSDLPTLLRKCIALGGATGSERLRDWASSELKGYASEEDLPDYRTVTAPLLMDGFSGNYHVTKQAVPIMLIPDVARDMLEGDVQFPQPIAEIADLLTRAHAQNETAVRIQPAGGAALVALMNHELAQAGQQHQSVERIYWSVILSPLARILDVVRTNLVELVAEMRAATPCDLMVPTREAAEQAVDIAIYGKKNRVIINQVGPGSNVASAAGGTASVGSRRESESRAFMWWLAAIATIISAAAAVWLLLK